MVDEVDPQGGGTGAPVIPDNPAWTEALNTVPESLRELVKPAFKQWDDNVNKEFEKRAEKYKKFEPFVDTDEDELQESIQLYRALAANPKQIYDLIAEHYNLQPASPAAPVTPVVPLTPEGEPDVYQQEINSLREQLKTSSGQQEQVLKYLVAQREEQQLAVKTNELDRLMLGLHEANKDLFTTPEITAEADKYIFTQMANGASAEDALKGLCQIAETFAKTLTPSTPAPVVIGSGGGLPSEQKDITQLSSKEIRDLSTKLLLANRDS